ncbi:MAG: T9SS type A sorting domain-containing protein [Bacteroidota bacterium]
MKKLTALFTTLFISLGLSAQITITSTDMPDVGDTTRLSNANVLFGIDPSVTGPDFTWDFSTLEPQNQTVEGYVSPQSTPFLYQIIFNQNVANLASPLQAIDFLPGLEVTDAYIFYKETNTSYVRAGYAVTIAGVPVPMKFDNPELMYTFPLQASSEADSSFSLFSFEFPGFGFISIERKRVNEVDGWGSVTTPYGTFNALRVKSEITERDSLYIDSLQVGVPVNRFYTEYKWLANGYSAPVLTITQEGPLVTAQYIDTIQNLTPLSVNLGPEQTICRGNSATLAAEVLGGTPPYSYFWSTNETTDSIRVSPAETTSYTLIVTDAQNNMAFGSITINVTDYKDINLGADTLLCAGFSISFDAGEGLEQIRWYVNGTEESQSQVFTVDSTGIGLNNAIIRIEYEDNGCSDNDEIMVNFYICEGLDDSRPVSLMISPNPAQAYLLVEQGRFTGKAEVKVVTSEGKLLQVSTSHVGSGRMIVNAGSLKPGSYLLIVSEGNYKGVARFIKQ